MLGKIKEAISKKKTSKEKPEILLKAQGIYCLIQEDHEGIFVVPILVSVDQSTFVDIETNDHYHVQVKHDKTGVLPKLKELPKSVAKEFKKDGDILELVPLAELCERICGETDEQDFDGYELIKTCTDKNLIMKKSTILNVTDTMEKYFHKTRNQTKKL